MSGLTRTLSKWFVQADPLKNVSNNNLFKKIIDPAGTTASRLNNGGALTLGTVIDPGGEFQKKKPTAPAPTLAMPDQVQVDTDARKRAASAAKQRSGRASTILSQGAGGSGDTLG